MKEVNKVQNTMNPGSSSKFSPILMVGTVLIFVVGALVWGFVSQPQSAAQNIPMAADAVVQAPPAQWPGLNGDAIKKMKQVGAGFSAHVLVTMLKGCPGDEGRGWLTGNIGFKLTNDPFWSQVAKANQDKMRETKGCMPNVPEQDIVDKLLNDVISEMDGWRATLASLSKVDLGTVLASLARIMLP
jgi:hypothetical protein